MKIQTNSRNYEGQCKFCGQDFTKRKIIDHLNHCEQRGKIKKAKNLRLRVADPYMKNFWLIVEVNDQAKLKDLDSLIRDVWVECCGHLSQFGDYGSQVSKSRVIMDTLNPGDRLNYIYDFGSSTELLIEALGYRDCGLGDKKKLELVARNYLPPSNCIMCGEQAVLICTACDSRNGMAFVCNKCAKEHHNEDNEDGDHFLLPLANSPRCGVCGYEPEESLDQLFLK